MNPSEWTVRRERSSKVEQIVEKILNEPPQKLVGECLPLERYVKTLKRILESISKAKTIGFKALRRDCRVNPYTLQGCLGGLKKAGAIEIVPASKRGKSMKITIGDRFGRVFERFALFPRYDSIELKVDGRKRGKIRLKFQNVLSVEEMYKIIEDLALTPTLFGFLLHNQELLDDANIKVTADSDQQVKEFEDEIWHHIIKIAAKCFGKKEEYFEDIKYYCTYRLPDVFAYAFGLLPPKLGELKSYYLKCWEGVNLEEPKFKTELAELIDFIQEALNNVEVKKWINRRLEEDPDFIVPSPIWFKCDFDGGTRTWSGRISLPYNILIVEPKYALTIDVLFCILEWLAFRWRNMKKYGPPHRADPYLKDLLRFQNSMDVFLAWRLFRESEFCKEHGEIFEPIESAFERYKNTGQFTDLARVYQDLLSGVLKTPKKAAKAVADGKYVI